MTVAIKKGKLEGAVVVNNSFTSKTEDEATGTVVKNYLTRIGAYSIADITDGSVIVPLMHTMYPVIKKLQLIRETWDNFYSLCIRNIKAREKEATPCQSILR